MITDEEAQRTLTGQSAAQAIASINRQVSTGVDSSGKISNNFNQKAVQGELTVASAFAVAAANEVGDYAQGKREEAKALIKQAEAENDPLKKQALNDQSNAIMDTWKEGGPGVVALHAAVGGLLGGASGALGAGATAVAMPTITEQIQQLDVPEGIKDALTVAAGAAVGGVVGGKIGAVTAANEVTNNFLKHQEAAAMRQDFEQCSKKPGGCSDSDYLDIRNKYLAVSRANITAVEGCIFSGNVACVSNLEQQAASPNEISNKLVGADYTTFYGREDNITSFGSVKGNASLFGTDVSQAADIAAFRQSSCAGLSASACNSQVRDALSDRMARVVLLGLAAGMTPLVVRGVKVGAVAAKAVFKTEPEIKLITTKAPATSDDLYNVDIKKPVVTSEGKANAATVEGLKNQLANENLLNIASRDARLAAAINGSGSANPNFSIGAATTAAADQLGRIWVGDGAKMVTNQAACPGCWKSADGLRIYRPPTEKTAPSNWNPTGVQANFVQQTPAGIIISNGHLVVSP